MGLVELLLYISTIVIFVRWIYFAHKNLPELGARYLRFSAAWAAGCFFVPLINLWMPFLAMRDLAKASRSPARWDLEDTPGVIVAWWSLWLIVGFLSASSARSGINAAEFPQVVAALSIPECVMAVPLYLLARLIVRRIWRDQSQRAQAAQVTAVA